MSRHLHRWYEDHVGVAAAVKRGSVEKETTRPMALRINIVGRKTRRRGGSAAETTALEKRGVKGVKIPFLIPALPEGVDESRQIRSSFPPGLIVEL